MLEEPAHNLRLSIVCLSGVRPSVNWMVWLSEGTGVMVLLRFLENEKIWVTFLFSFFLGGGGVPQGLESYNFSNTSFSYSLQI